MIHKKPVGFVFLNYLDKKLKLLDLIKSFKQQGISTKGVFLKPNHVGLKLYVETETHKL